MLGLPSRSASRPGPRARLAPACLLIAAGLLASCGGKTRQRPAGPQPSPDAGPRKVVYTDIAHAYHGLLLDGERREIVLDRAGVESLQDSMLEALTALPKVAALKTEDGQPLVRRDWKTPLDGAFVEKALGGFKFTDDERMLTKSLLMQRGVESSPDEERVQYEARAGLITERVLGYVNSRGAARLRPEYEGYVGGLELGALLGRLLRPRGPGTDYIEACRGERVPIPPDWPGGWHEAGELPPEFNYVLFRNPGDAPKVKVWTYTTPDGVCYALPRMEGASVSYLGIICQSRVSGKACFWDNIRYGDTTDERIIGEASLRLGELKNGWTLTQNCTDCHRGDNAFVIHPNTPLAAAPEEVRNPEPPARYEPMGQAGWVNPPPVVRKGTTGCASCHSLPDPASTLMSYCGLARWATEKTMPDPRAPARWARPEGYFSAHVNALKMRCGQ